MSGLTYTILCSSQEAELEITQIINHVLSMTNAKIPKDKVSIINHHEGEELVIPDSNQLTFITKIVEEEEENSHHSFFVKIRKIIHGKIIKIKSDANTRQIMKVIAFCIKRLMQFLPLVLSFVDGPESSPQFTGNDFSILDDVDTQKITQIYDPQVDNFMSLETVDKFRLAGIDVETSPKLISEPKINEELESATSKKMRSFTT